MIPPKPVVLAHFGLRRNPFGRLQSSDDYYRSPEFRLALQMVEYALDHDDVVAFVGDIGSGKTDAMEMVQEVLAAEPDRKVQFIRPEVPDKGYLRIQHVTEAMLHELQMDTLPASVQRRNWLLRKLLTQLRQLGQKTCLVLDEAHRLTGPFLKSLKEFHEQMRFGLRASLFSVVLIGHRHLLEHYAKVARDVWERLDVGNCALLGQMNPLEGSAYIAHRLASVGAPELFDEAARLAAARLATSPLALNVVCWKVLEAAYLEGQPRITESSVLAAFDRGALAERLGLSLGEIAARAGLGKSTVSDALKGKAGPKAVEAVDQVLRGARPLAAAAEA